MPALKRPLLYGEGIEIMTGDIACGLPVRCEEVVRIELARTHRVIPRRYPWHHQLPNRSDYL